MGVAACATVESAAGRCLAVQLAAVGSERPGATTRTTTTTATTTTTDKTRTTTGVHSGSLPAMSSTAPISDFCDVPHRAEATAALLVLPALATSAFAAAAGCGEVSVASKEEAAQFRALLPDASELDPAQLRVAERLGGGTWSAVHRGELLGRAVAVKLLRAGRMLVPSSADRPLQDQALLAAGVLAREAAFLSELRHPRVVELLTVGILQGRPCLVLELAHGSLHSLLHGGLSANSVSEVPLGPAQRWSMAIHVAEGVSYLHAHQPGVVHCDLKSSNILVFHNNMSNNNNSNSNNTNNTNNKEGLQGIPGTQVLTAKLADFGLARRHHNNNSNKNNNNNKKTQHNNNNNSNSNNNKNNDNTNTNTNNNTNNTNNIPAAQPDALSGEAGNLCRGSGAYLAPECLADPSEIQGPTVDLWALGCVLVEVFGGAPPHTECESMEQVWAKVLGRGEGPCVPSHVEFAAGGLANNNNSNNNSSTNNNSNSAASGGDALPSVAALLASCLSHQPSARPSADCLLEELRLLAARRGFSSGPP
ncbi:unnamed protein product [Polarella glacialis]|uniref:Protein kinase domain-containing protein n=1 Tax=Polarella glacialis TaxID=89957 RepID=A0A813H2A2_POLGL|nr:unnamed protein product [Polarella glacialis]